MNERELRTAFGSFGTGVAAATLLCGEESAYGLTINSFSSVSLSPPLLSWCLGHDSEMAAEFTKAKYFGISILAAAQQDLSARLAHPATHKLLQTDYVLSPNNLPQIKNALAHFDCKVEQTQTIGDHIQFIGAIENAICCDKGRDPLLYFRGNYTSV